ncbi:MAG: FAD-dependent oxidoreductase [Kiritimatiellia bacterium]
MGAMPHVAVLGGGVCGLYAARTLARAGCPVTVLDLGRLPGGLSGSRSQGGNFYDIGVHMFHQFDRKLTEDILAVMGGESIPVRLDARIRWAGATYRYPLQFMDMLKGMPFWRLAYCSLGLLGAHAIEAARRAPPANAQDALIRLYGRPLYEFFFREFTHRYWGMPPRELSATFVSTKMPRLTAVDVIKRALARFGISERPGRAVESALLDETLLYARTGAEALPRRLSEAVQRDGGIVMQSAEATKVMFSGGRVAAIRFSRNGEDREISCDGCVSTIPLTTLVKISAPVPPQEVAAAAANLRFKPVAIYGLLVRRERCLEAQYVYFRDRSFHRVGEPKNAGLKVTPPGHTILIAESTCEEGDAKWRGAPEAREAIAADLEAEGICRKDEIAETHVFGESFGYPVFSLGFEQNLARAMAWVRSVPNLQSAGRQGAFEYPNMHKAMRMGEAAALAIMGAAGLSAR